MGETYRIDLALRIIFSTGEGVLTDEDVFNHLERLRSDPDFNPAFSQLVDCTEITDLKVTTYCIRRVARMEMFAESARRAIVAPQHQVFGMARMFEMMHAGPEEVMVFRDIKEARRWLGIE